MLSKYTSTVTDNTNMKHQKGENTVCAFLRLYGVHLSLGVKLLEQEADHSTSVEVKNVWSFNSTPYIHLKGAVLVDGENCTFPVPLHF
jgi:hypothetical protein